MWIIDRLEKLFHRHRWIDYDDDIMPNKPDIQSIKIWILPTRICTKCGVISKYFGPGHGWKNKV